MTNVYIMRAETTDNYKIGISDNPIARLATIQTSHYLKIEIIKTLSYDSRFIALSIEDFLHKKYKEYNTVGEWFKLTDKQVIEVISYLEKGVTETILLKARIKELEKEIIELRKRDSDKNSFITKPQTKTITDKDLISKLWNGGAVQKGDKLTPKSQVINISKMSEVKQLSAVYKDLVSNGYAELRGNKGYYALTDYQTALNTK